MNKAYLTVGLIILSIFAFATINLLQNYSNGSELDYYLLKETTDAAMSDSLDSAYYTERGVYRIDKEKFVESFILRFGSNVDDSRNYKLTFVDINEIPPKVTVQVDAMNSSLIVDGTQANISTRINAILESNNTNDPILVNKYLPGNY